MSVDQPTTESRHPDLQIFVSGTWQKSKAIGYRSQGLILGELLAGAGFDLTCGPGTGIARHVIDGFRSVPVRRGMVRYYLPLRSEMERVGESVEEGADEIIQTGFDYPMRNIWQVKQSHGIFVLTGGDGALEEALPALIDYGLPVAAVDGAGAAANALRRLVEVFPQWNTLLLMGPDVSGITESFIERVRAANVVRRRSCEGASSVESTP